MKIAFIFLVLVWQSTKTAADTATAKLQTKTSLTYPPRCKADVVFLIDESSTITPVNFNNYVKPFLINLTYGLQISSSDTHLALVHFSDPEVTEIDFRFNSPISANPPLIADYIRRMPFEAGNKALYKALTLTYTDVMTQENGARISEWGKTVAAYVFIITNGVATDIGSANLSQLTSEMAKSGIVIYVANIGSLIDEKYLFEITHDYNRIYKVNDFSKLSEEFLERFLNDTSCPMPPAPAPLRQYHINTNTN